MTYRKRIKKTKLTSFEDALRIGHDHAKASLGRELTPREIKYLKRMFYASRKVVMKGYVSIPLIQFIDQLNSLTQSFQKILDKTTIKES